MTGSIISGAQHPISPGQRKRNIRSKRHTVLKTAFELDGVGGDDDDDSHDVISTQIRALELSPSTSDATSATHNDCDPPKCPDASESLQSPSYNNHARDFAGNHQQSACRSCRAQQTRVGKSRRTSVLHSLLQTERRMSFAEPKVDQLDRTDELAIAAELLLLHKSSNFPLDSRRTPSPSHTAQSDDDAEDSETASVRHMSSVGVCSERGQCSSAGPVFCDECTSSQSSQAISPSTLSFRREREQNAIRAESVSYLHRSTIGSPDTLHRARQSRSLTPHFRRISTHTTPSITAQLAASPNDAVTAQSAPLAYGTRSKSVPSHVQ